MAMPADWTPPNSGVGDFNAHIDIGPEREIWRNEVMTGIIHRRIAEVQIITNHRVLLNDRDILLNDLDDIVVMNQHRESQGSSTRYSARGFSTSFGTGRSSGKSIGDVVFMHQGQTSIIFSQIADPSGVAKLAKAARRSMINLIKTHEKIQAKALKEREQAPRQGQKPVHSETTSNTDFVNSSSQDNALLNRDYIGCQKCGNNNPQDAKFCGMCGTALMPACTQCGHLNPPNSSFCNKCGFALA